MIAQLYAFGDLVATMPGVPDGTRELIVGEAMLATAVAISETEAETLVGVRGHRMVLREGTVDTFDLVHPWRPAP